jgi:hypothetical protein
MFHYYLLFIQIEREAWNNNFKSNGIKLTVFGSKIFKAFNYWSKNVLFCNIKL